MYIKHGITGFHTYINERGAYCQPGADFMISVDIPNFQTYGPSEENIKVMSRSYWKNAKPYRPVIVEDLNSIDALILNHFVFIDIGSVQRIGPAQNASDFWQPQTLSGQELFNASNELSPLKVYRLKRTFRTTFSEKSNEKVEEKVETHWDVEVLDHSKNVPCSRTDHCITVNRAGNCLYLFGGITKLMDVEFKHCPDKIRDPKFWRKKQLCDLWKLCFTTNTWEKVLDIYPESQSQPLASTTPPFFLSNLQLVHDPLRDLIYGCYQKYKLKDNSEIIITLNVICIDPITKRFEEYSYKTPNRAGIAFRDSVDRLYLEFWAIERSIALELTDEKKFNMKRPATTQLLTPCKRATIVHGPSKTARRPLGLRCWKSFIEDLIHDKL